MPACRVKCSLFQLSHGRVTSAKEMSSELILARCSKRRKLPSDRPVDGSISVRQMARVLIELVSFRSSQLCRRLLRDLHDQWDMGEDGETNLCTLPAAARFNR